MKRRFRLLGQALLLVIVWAVIFEIGLRMQQYFGPLYDLEMANANLNWESNVLNHQPAPESQNLCIYGDLTGFSYKTSYDANGIRIIDDTALLAGCRHPISILFLGDSFMEGFDDRNTLPYHVAKYFKTERGVCLKTYNAGYTSYSPAIFVPQARKLLPIVRPDYIVVDVDETDLYDDFARYRKLIVRNERGQNVGVKVSPIGHECSIGLMEAREHPLYLMRFVGKLWLSYVRMPSAQMPGAHFVCTALGWRRGYHREIKIDARPIVILQPMGPILFVFDVSDTAPLPNARPLPVRVEDPFQVRSGKIGGQLGLTIENAKRDGVRVSERADGSQQAGSIQWAAAGQHLEFTIANKQMPASTQVPLWFELLLNSSLSAERRFGTLIHELAHLYCGHLGTPNGRWWPDRKNLSHVVREFEAESVSYLVCARFGIDTASDEYLAGYVRKSPDTPAISLDRVLKSVWLLEQMGQARLGLRKAAISQPTSGNV